LFGALCSGGFVGGCFGGCFGGVGAGFAVGGVGGGGLVLFVFCFASSPWDMLVTPKPLQSSVFWHAPLRNSHRQPLSVHSLHSALFQFAQTVPNAPNGKVCATNATQNHGKVAF